MLPRLILILVLLAMAGCNQTVPNPKNPPPVEYAK
jgi:hypothetical protein